MSSEAKACVALPIDAKERDQRADAITNDWAGIFAPFEAFYIESMIYCASRASQAFLRFDVARVGADTEANQVSAIHEALTHAAALSRFFWPAAAHGGKPGAARGAKLREAFEVCDDTPLHDRELRNALEHFDERLDGYLLERDTGYFYPGKRCVAHVRARHTTRPKCVKHLRYLGAPHVVAGGPKTNDV